MKLSLLPPSISALRVISLTLTLIVDFSRDGIGFSLEDETAAATLSEFLWPSSHMSFGTKMAAEVESSVNSSSSSRAAAETLFDLHILS